MQSFIKQEKTNFEGRVEGADLNLNSKTKIQDCFLWFSSNYLGVQHWGQHQQLDCKIMILVCEKPATNQTQQKIKKLQPTADLRWRPQTHNNSNRQSFNWTFLMNSNNITTILPSNSTLSHTSTQSPPLILSQHLLQSINISDYSIESFQQHLDLYFNETITREKKTPLHIAAEHGLTEYVQLFINAGVNVNIPCLVSCCSSSSSSRSSFFLSFFFSFACLFNFFHSLLNLLN